MNRRILASALAAAFFAVTSIATASEPLPTSTSQEELAATDACADCNPRDACYDPCASSPWFLEAEGLLWWRKSRPLPPLVTTSPIGTAQADAGVLDAAGTAILFGSDNYNDGPQAGARLSLGRWLDAEQLVGVGASFYFLGQENIEETFVAAGASDILAVPFFNATLGAEDALLANFPGVTSNGQVNVQYQNDVLGGDAYLRHAIYADWIIRVDALAGYQFARVDDGLQLNANYNDAGLANANLDVQDRFLAKNEFHGGALGMLARVESGLWSVKAIAKCGLGNMHQTVDISGRTITTPIAGAPTTTAGGLLALPTNIGRVSNDEFAIVPEAKLNIGYRVTPNWTLGVGYSFIYFSDVMTAGRAIDRNLNLTQIPGPLVGPAVPAPPTFANTSDFWVQGLNFSAEFAY